MKKTVKLLPLLLSLLLLFSCKATQNEIGTNKENTEEGENTEPKLIVSLKVNADITLDYSTVEALEGGVFAVLDSDFDLGLIDTAGNVLLPCEYSSKRAPSEGIMPIFKEGAGWGYYSIEQRKMIADCKYKTVMNFSEGLGCVYDGENYFYLDKDGNHAIDTVLYEATSFSDGLARALSADTYGYMDKNGEFPIVCDFDYFDDFHEGLARVSDGKQFGFMGKNGKMKFVCHTDRIYNFKDGLACVVVGGKQGYIDTEGKTVIAPAFDAMTNSMTDEYFEFRCGVAPVMMGEKYGAIDKEGNIVIPAEYDQLMFAVENIVRVKKDGKFGYILADGTQISDCIYDSAASFSEGVAKVSIGDGYFYINTKGERLCEQTFFDATLVTNGTAAVFNNDTNSWNVVTFE